MKKKTIALIATGAVLLLGGSIFGAVAFNNHQLVKAEQVRLEEKARREQIFEDTKRKGDEEEARQAAEEAARLAAEEAARIAEEEAAAAAAAAKKLAAEKAKSDRDKAFSEEMKRLDEKVEPPKFDFPPLYLY